MRAFLKLGNCGLQLFHYMRIAPDLLIHVGEFHAHSACDLNCTPRLFCHLKSLVQIERDNHRESCYEDGQRSDDHAQES